MIVSKDPAPGGTAARVGRGVRALRLLDAAVRIQKAFDAAGIRSVALKGAALHGAIYKDVAERSMVDADLWVLHDFRRAEAVVLAAGFHPIGRADHAAAFEESASGAILEVHWSPTSAPGLFAIDPDSVWNRRRRLLTGLVAPSAVDTLVLLALHAAFQHGLVLRPDQHGDFERLVEVEAIDPAEAAARAREWSAETALAAAIEVAAALSGWPAALAGLRSVLPPLPRRLAAHVATAATAPQSFFVPATSRLAFVRFELLAGRRLSLLRRTLWGDRRLGPAPASATAGFRRGVRLARRYLVPRSGSAS